MEQPRPQGVAKKQALRFCMSAARIACALALPGCSSLGSTLVIERVVSTARCIGNHRDAELRARAAASAGR